jgi:ABC-type glycerol-3-phosphate transport system substrate-binding protein
MRRILSLLLLSALFLSACVPTVTLLSSQPDLVPTAQATLLPPPIARTPVPTPTPDRRLNISPSALKGVEVRVWQGWDGTSTRLFDQMATEFTLSNKWGIKVTVVPQGNLSLLGTAMEKSLGTPEQPDMVVALPEQILGWQPQVIDLAPYVEQPDLGLDLKELPAAFGDQSTLNGVRYGLPAARSARFLFYNVSFAFDLGFTSAPQTAEDFRKQACAANAFWKQDKDLTNDGFGGLALDSASNWQTPYSWLAAGGGQIFSDGQFKFNTPANTAALEFVSKLRDADCAWLPDTATNYEHLASRQALFITGSLADIADQNLAFSAAGSSDRWTLLPFPGQQPGIVTYGPDYAVLKSSDVRQMAAWLFIRWMLEPENQVRWSRGSGLLPVTTAAINTLKTDNTVTPQWAAALDLIPQAFTYPQTASWQLADKILADGFRSYFRGYPNIAIGDVLNVMDTTIQDLIKK